MKKQKIEKSKRNSYNTQSPKTLGIPKSNETLRGDMVLSPPTQGTKPR